MANVPISSAAGIVRGWIALDVSSEDYVDPEGFILVAYGEGDLAYATALHPDVDELDTIEADDVPYIVGLGPNGAFMIGLCSKVISATTTASQIFAGYR